MQAPSLPDNEPARLRRLRRLALLDTSAEAVLDTYTRLAAATTGMPIALISMIDADRQWFKSAVGMEQGTETPREVSFCGHAILQDDIFEVEDATRDARFFDNPLTTGDPHVVHYAGAPLTMPDGERIGTLCLIGQQPGKLTGSQRDLLKGMAAGVVEVLKLREQEHHLRSEKELSTSAALTEFSPVGLFSCDAAGQMLFANDQWAALMGLDDPADRVGDAWVKAIHPEELGWLARDWAAAIRDRSSFIGTVRLVRHGEDAWIRFRVVPVALDGRHSGFVGAVVDVTETRRLERALRQNNELLHKAVRAAEEATEAKSIFLATMSHEIRTPINGVLGLSRLLMGSELPEDSRAHVKMIDNCANTLLALVNDVLDFSKIEAGQVELDPQPENLAEFVREQAQLFALAAQEKGIAFHANVASDVPEWIVMDAHRVRQIVGNLLSNALKFTLEGGVGLEVSRTGPGSRSLRIDVRDSGVGIAPQALGRLFHKYAQADASIARRFKGTGLGLAISRQLAELMGGSLTVTSEVGRGSVFRFEMPLVQAVAPASLVEPAPEAVQRHSGAILVVDDNEVNRVVAAGLLKVLGHTDITLATNGIEALAAVSRRSFDLVFMDCQMPGMDGLQATRELRARGFARAVVALTAASSQQDADDCLAAGMNAVLLKPFTRGELAACLARWLAPQPQPACS